MQHELILIADKLESSKCNAHAEKATIKVVRGKMQICCCCDEHKRFLERQIEYEMHKLFVKEDEGSVSVEGHLFVTHMTSCLTSVPICWEGC